METWVGASEGQLVSGWGKASSARTGADGKKLLTYSQGYTDLVVGNGGVVTREVKHACDITWTIQDGVAVGYHWAYAVNPNDCKSVAVNARSQR
jgi:hypothetical protein